ncbi:hypothetical protein MPER_15432, partial [Moniliophthora perniciosa FA553]
MVGEVSQSGQWAVSRNQITILQSVLMSNKPFNAHYEWFNTSANFILNDPKTTKLNSYMGGALQQATSGVSMT